MKKLISALLILALCLSMVPAALAEAEVAEDVVSYTWEMFEPVAAELGWEGEFVTLEEAGLKFWLPSFMEPSELDAEDPQGIFIGYFKNTEKTLTLGITMSNPGMTEESMLEYLKDNGVKDGTVGIINDIRFIGYSYTNVDGVVCNVASVVYEDGSVVEFAFGGDAENLEEVATIILTSIQIAD